MGPTGGEGPFREGRLPRNHHLLSFPPPLPTFVYAIASCLTVSRAYVRALHCTLPLPCPLCRAVQNRAVSRNVSWKRHAQQKEKIQRSFSSGKRNRSCVRVRPGPVAKTRVDDTSVRRGEKDSEHPGNRSSLVVDSRPRRRTRAPIVGRRDGEARLRTSRPSIRRVRPT